MSSSSNPKVIFRKKAYNSTTDALTGIVVFDTTTHKIFVGGECYSSDVKNATYNSNTSTITITKSDNTTITIDLSSFESASNKVTSLSSASTHTQYPSAKCVYDSIRKKPVVVWEAETVSQGILATESDITANPTWQLTGLNMSDFATVELYIRGGTSSTSSFYTPSIIIEIDLDSMNLSPLGHYIGSAMGQYPNDRNRLLAVTAAISSDKTSVLFSRCTSLYGTGATSGNDNERVLYKIVGYYD